MFEPKVFNHHAIMEDGSAVLYHMVIGQDGLACVKASFAAITFKVFNEATRIQIGTAGTVNIANCVFDTLQTIADDPRVAGSDVAEGFNFRHTVSASYFPEGNAIYRVEYYAIQSAALGNEPTAWANNIPTIDLIGS